MDLLCITPTCFHEYIQHHVPMFDIYMAAATNIMLMVGCLITKFSITKCLPVETWPTDASDNLSDLTFDFVIVGSGSAGSVLANRLTEVPHWRVLLIEAGDDPPIFSSIPLLGAVMQKTQYDWQYKSENDSRTCKGLKDGMCVMPRGKMLGGTSSLNGMIYVRGNPKDYDDIAANGNPGWDYNEVLKYFIKSEKLNHPEVQRHPTLKNYHGNKGPVNVESFSRYGTHPLVEPLMDAFEEIGSPRVLDINGPSQIGTVRLQGTIKDGGRESSATAYLVSAAKRSNLIVWKRSLATKILFKNNVAIAVNVIVGDNKLVRVNVRKEVILSCGTFNTPQLLMLSGIGPKKHLERMKIKVIADLPVGKNLHDHFSVPTIMQFRNGLPISSIFSNAALYIFNKTGSFAQLGAAEVNTMINTEGENSRPNVQILSFYLDAGMHLTAKYVMANYFGYNERTAQALSDTNKDMPIMFTLHALLNPKSKGRVVLRNTDPKSQPKIYLNYLSDKSDLDALIRSMEYTARLVDTESFKKMNATLFPFDIEECNRLRFPSEPYSRCVAHNLGQSTWHPMGTAKMGSSDDPTSVVDPSLRVRGVRRLRVVDGSVIPSQISGNTNAPIIMFAEKASDLIKAEYHENVSYCQDVNDTLCS